jgi:hypothetical protein
VKILIGFIFTCIFGQIIAEKYSTNRGDGLSSPNRENGYTALDGAVV